MFTPFCCGASSLSLSPSSLLFSHHPLSLILLLPPSPSSSLSPSLPLSPSSFLSHPPPLLSSQLVLYTLNSTTTNQDIVSGASFAGFPRKETVHSFTNMGMHTQVVQLQGQIMCAYYCTEATIHDLQWANFTMKVPILFPCQTDKRNHITTFVINAVMSSCHDIACKSIWSSPATFLFFVRTRGEPGNEAWQGSMQH